MAAAGLACGDEAGFSKSKGPGPLSRPPDRRAPLGGRIAACRGCPTRRLMGLLWGDADPRAQPALGSGFGTCSKRDDPWTSQPWLQETLRAFDVFAGQLPVHQVAPLRAPFPLPDEVGSLADPLLSDLVHRAASVDNSSRSGRRYLLLSRMTPCRGRGAGARVTGRLGRLSRVSSGGMAGMGGS